ncbi:dienelactone hydrolase family protein [Tolypothrix sp. FACHB-123]|uniref:dienelactone hydrolase family protein n=1 Tax=Tolypothrix sp. FACHB-123 TaxID=2692868 RepID=UPI0016867A75|nr:dienelactone hydrolase family protein [Tolypothrix sp. FACHB-123]MBD2355480.1 dienelactone hydrolase family protein [Tolypothrix sp. FACHB-123]
MQIEQTEVIIPTPDGEMSAWLYTHAEGKRQPAVILLMEAFGLTSHIRDIAARIAKEGYVVLAPDLYYRELPNNKFGYDQVESAMAMMYRLDFGKPMKEDMQAALAYVKSRADVYPDKIGMTGFCLGGGLSFFTACYLSSEIVAAAPFYGMVLDEWLVEAKNITVPIYLFFGGVDPFIPSDRIQQVESRLQELGKEYNIKVYPDADHGFFCNERYSYNPVAAEDAWRELTGFFHKHLQEQ